jgi:hypothetical protein
MQISLIQSTAIPLRLCAGKLQQAVLPAALV